MPSFFQPKQTIAGLELKEPLLPAGSKPKDEKKSSKVKGKPKNKLQGQLDVCSGELIRLIRERDDFFRSLGKKDRPKGVEAPETEILAKIRETLDLQTEIINRISKRR